jgi:hypothetical protein
MEKVSRQLLLVLATLFGALYPALGLIDYSCLHSTSWVINNDNHTNAYFSHTATDIATSAYSSSKNKWEATGKRIPNYDHKFSSTEITTLNSRPAASVDFTSGATTASVGSSIVFGQSIGYKYTSGGCAMGYWPPGPVCPTALSVSYTFHLKPAPETHSGGMLHNVVPL